LPGFGVKGKENITVLNCLLHNAGFFDDPRPGYWTQEFGCPESSKLHPRQEFSCTEKIYHALLNMDLEREVNHVYVYSDLSYITLMHVVGSLAREFKYITESDLNIDCSRVVKVGVEQCYFEAYVRKFVFHELNMMDTQFLPPIGRMQRCTPTRNDTHYRHMVTQGVVDDENAYSMGGIAGHAGVFSTSQDMYKFMRKWMFPTENDTMLNSTTVKFWIKEYNHSQSSRALGWNTNDPLVFDMGWGQSCGDKFSPKGFTHTGFTGTQVCGDFERGIFTILLTNRVYPSSNNADKIRKARKLFGNTVIDILNEGEKKM